MKVSIVIPIYNAVDFVENSVQEIVGVLDPLGMDYEVLLWDDGSLDRSRSILERLSHQHPQVQCFYNLSNEGLGTTLIKLFNNAQGQYVIYCDCDLPFGADIIIVLLDKLQTYDIAVASRYSGASNHVQFLRRIFSRAYYMFCKILFNIPIIDIGSGSVAISRKALNKLDLKIKGFGIHAEIYKKALHQDLLIAEIPAESRRSNQKSFSILRHGPNIIFETIQLKLEMLKITSQFKKVKKDASLF